MGITSEPRFGSVLNISSSSISSQGTASKYWIHLGIIRSQPSVVATFKMPRAFFTPCHKSVIRLSAR
eukprot:Gb_20145 [translate_table: standard]